MGSLGRLNRALHHNRLILCLLRVDSQTELGRKDIINVFQIWAKQPPLPDFSLAVNETLWCFRRVGYLEDIMVRWKKHHLLLRQGPESKDCDYEAVITQNRICVLLSRVASFFKLFHFLKSCFSFCATSDITLKRDQKSNLDLWSSLGSEFQNEGFQQYVLHFEDLAAWWQKE